MLAGRYSGRLCGLLGFVVWFSIACWLVGFCCLVWILFAVSVGMFAGSLVSGCQFPCHFFGICRCLATAVLIGLMAYWFARFSLFGFVLLDSSAEMCAGALAPGCRTLGIYATRSQVYGAHGCHLACLAPLLWRPGGPWDDPGTILGRSWDIGGHKEGPCEVQAWILSIF